MNFVIIQPSFDVAGGEQRVTMEIIKELIRRGQKVIIVSDYPPTKIFDIKGNVFVASFNLVRKIFRYMFPQINCAYLVLRALPYLYHSDCTIVSGDFLPFKKIISRFSKTVIFFHTSSQANKKKMWKIIHAFFKMLISIRGIPHKKHRCVYFCNSSFTAKRVEKIHKLKCIILYPPVSFTNLSSIPKKKKMILFVGRLHPMKRYHIILEKIKSKYNVIKSNCYELVMAGFVDSSKNIEYFKSLKRKYPFVNMYINIPDRKLVSLYENSEILIFTNPDEYFGLVVLEGMNFGNIVIVPKGCGASEIITHGKNGFLYKYPKILPILLEVIKIPKTKKKNVMKNAILTSRKFTTKRFVDSIIHHINDGEDKC